MQQAHVITSKEIELPLARGMKPPWSNMLPHHSNALGKGKFEISPFRNVISFDG
jgi:hypothetical protein